MQHFGYFVVILVALFGVVDVAMVTVEDDKPVMANNAYRSFAGSPKEEDDLVYSDDYKNYIENRRQLYQQMRDYGVPSDVAQLYVPRGLTIGDIFGPGKTESNEEHSSGDDTAESADFDPWTIVWYIGSFGGLIAFFLVVSCSEWCCLRNRAAHRQQQLQQRACQAGVERVRANSARPTCDTPPPSYHLFAPPPYDSVNYEEKKYDIFVVPVHAATPEYLEAVKKGNLKGEAVPPPDYTEIQMQST